ncbi:lysis system i-spanin subunit Rz [Herbaspirillum sp. ST 5-3]|uniref:lysis system i-spanin subunit Rz n=1 Tax=Oxalobacteraceae TaxID=75682 RepID=UPI00145608D9|nr:lysis system i-spanin subunit Rz [Herbaspirillum sp. ST 5-3]
MNIPTFLLDPRFWLAIVIWTAAVAFVSHDRGERLAMKEAERKELKASVGALEDKIRIDAETREKERRLVRILDNRYDKYQQEELDAKAKADRLIADLRSHVRRLSIPVSYASCAAGANPAAGAAGGSSQEGRADITAGAGEFLVRLADRGDTAIRKHAEVVDRYELLRQACTQGIPAEVTP